MLIFTRKSAALLSTVAACAALALWLRAPSHPHPPGAQALNELTARVHFAFRAEGPAFVGGPDSYAAKLEGSQLELRARHAGVTGAPLRLRATELSRGAAPLSAAPPTVALDAKGGLRLARQAVIEHLENGPTGLSQSWEFPALPAGAGPLELRVPVEGGFAGETASGLHFSTGALGFDYGHATWIDASGARTPIPARWDGTAIALQVPEALLETSAYPAVLDPLVSPEISLDQPITIPALNNQSTPALAFNGTTYLAAWVDERVGGHDIYAARLSAAGAVLDPAGIRLTSSNNSLGEVAIASDGTDFLLAWQDTASGGRATLHGGRVSAAGTALDLPDVLLVTNVSVDALHPSLAFGGGAYLLVWEEYDEAEGLPPDVIRGLRVSTGAQVLSGPFTVHGTVSDFESNPDVDFDGTNFLVVYETTAGSPDINIAGVRVSTSGVPGSPFTIAGAAGAQMVPSVAWNGANHLVAWHDTRNSVNYDVYAARVSAAGVVLDPAGFAVSAAAGLQQDVDVTAQGSGGFMLVWEDTRDGGADIWGAHVSPSAVVSPVGGEVISAGVNSQVAPVVASDGTNALALWADNRTTPPGNTDLYGTLINASNVVQSPAGVLVGQQANAQTAGAVAFDGTNYLVVWEDLRGVTPDLYGARVSKAGVVLDVPAFVISAAANSQKAPAVTFTGSTYFVAWQDDRTTAANFDIYGARVSTSGAVLDPAGIAISTAANNQTAPAVTSDGTNALVVWQDERVVAGGSDIFGARVSSAGTVLDPAGVAISQATNQQTAPSVAWNGATYLVAWTDYRRNTYDVWNARLTPSLTVMDTAGIGLALSSGGTARQHPSVAALGNQFFVAWEDNRDAGFDIYGARVSPDSGTAIDSIHLPISTSAGDQRTPSVAADGTNYQIVWVDQRSGNADVYGGRVRSTTGAVLDGAGFAISTGATDEKAPAIASSGSRTFLVAYQAFVASSSANANRLMARTLANAPPVGTAQSLGTQEDTPLALTIGATDSDFDALTFTVLTQPSNGTLSGGPTAFTYSPASNYNGPDSFTFKANDGLTDSAPATISLTVIPVNDPPVALPQSVATPEDTPLTITLTGTDVEGSPLTYTLVNQPTHGSFTGTPPTLTYTPALNYNGPDSFTFNVGDGNAVSGNVTVSITISPVNDVPVATGQTVATLEDTSVGITLSGTDVEGSPLTYAIYSQPAHGTLSGTPPNVTYTPAHDFNGPDAFGFKVNDGTVDSPPATVNVNVTPVNDAPVAQDQFPGTQQDTSLAITLSASDVDGDALTYTILAQPTHGTVSSGTGAARTYVPSAGYRGSDAFTFKANDGKLDSNVATVTISVASVNQPPVATSQSLTTPEDTARAFTLTGSDSDGDTITFVVTGPPLHGTLSGTGASRTYTPALNYHGTDLITFHANDGQRDSQDAEITFTITAVNDAPVAIGQLVGTQEDTSLSLTLAGSDVDGDPLTFQVVGPPASGSLTGVPPNVVYTPALNFNGTDSFTFKVNDGALDSVATATVSISVTAVNDPPVAQSQALGTDQDTPRAITLTATDVDHDALTYSLVSPPAHGTIQGTPPSITYVPSGGYRGTDSFTFKAHDLQVDSNVATVTLAIASVNHPPVVQPQAATLDEDTSATITLTGSDPDGDSFTFALANPPAHGSITQAGARFTYTPTPNFNGADSFTVKANDGQLDSAAAAISLTVSPVNDAPLATSQALQTPEDLALLIVLGGTDVDGDPLGAEVLTQPTHGSLSGNPPNLTYTPALNYDGPDSFTFKVNDGTVDSPPATITLSISAVNDAPVALAQTVDVPNDTPTTVTLAGTDVDGDALTFRIVAQPNHGTLTGEAPNLTYTPEAGFGGGDSFTFVASDGVVESDPATVSVVVAPSGTSGPTPKDRAQVNGWSCGCSQSAPGPGVWALFGGLLVRLRRRRPTRASPRAPRAAILALAMLVSVGAAQAKPTAKKKATPAAPAPVPAPVPAPPPPPPAPVVVQPPPEPPGPPTLAALDVQVTVANEKLDATAFSSILASAADQTQLFKVISSSEIATMLGMERQKQLLGCAEDACLAELTGALGARYLLEGAVGRVAGNYLVSVRLIDARRSSVAGRATLQTNDAGELLRLIWLATGQAIDAAGATLPPDQAAKWKARPRPEPPKNVLPERTSWLGVAVSGVGGYQPLASAGLRTSVGGEFDVSWRLRRFDLAAGVVISPSPGGRLTVAFALLHERNRLSVAARGTIFPIARLYGGGPAVLYEFAFTPNFGLQASVAGEVYGGGGTPVLALLGGLGVDAHF